MKKTLTGWMTAESGRIEVEAHYATKYSVRIVLKEKAEIKEISNLELKVGESLVPLGPGKILINSENQDLEFHVMPVSGFHNFEKLFNRSKIETLEAPSLRLTSLISDKDKILPDFKEYVSNLAYDLGVYNYLLDKMDFSLKDEPAEVKDYIESAIINGLGKELMMYMKQAKQRLEELVFSFHENEHESHGFYFRRKLWYTLLQAPLIERSNLKPRGYNGDSEMMKMIYQNNYLGDSTFGKILHKFSVDQPAAQSVRNRRIDVVRFLRDFEADYKKNSEEKLRILSVACGPAFEIGDILKTKKDCSRFHFSLLDQDEQALGEASALIEGIEKSFKTKVSKDIHQESPP